VKAVFFLFLNHYCLKWSFKEYQTKKGLSEEIQIKRGFWKCTAKKGFSENIRSKKGFSENKR